MLNVIGLGNMGGKYENTPHNVGLDILNIIFEKNNSIFLSKRYDKKIHSYIASGFLGPKKVNLIFPELYINTSGTVVSKLKKENNVKEKKYDNIVIIHDDIDLPFGKIKIVFNSGHGGHNGIRDIEKVLDTKKIIRIKFGVGIVDSNNILRKPKNNNAIVKYLVDKKLSKKFRDIIHKKTENIENIIKDINDNGYEHAMNEFNGK